MAYGVSFVADFSAPEVTTVLGRARMSDDSFYLRRRQSDENWQLPTNDFSINRIGMSTSSTSYISVSFLPQNPSLAPTFGEFVMSVGTTQES